MIGYTSIEIKVFVEQLNQAESNHKEFKESFLFAKASDIIMQLLTRVENLEDSANFRNNY